MLLILRLHSGRLKIGSSSWLVSLMESQRQPVRISKASPNEEVKTTFFEGLRDASEVSKILDHIQNLAERNTSSTRLAAALQTELEHAYAQIQQLERAHKAVRKEMDKLLRKLADERAIRRTMEKEKFESAMQNLQDEIEGERKSKHELEITNSRLGRQLGEANMALARALQDLERERKTREVLEDVRNDFTRKVGHDKSEAELKLASGRVKEVEQQQKILQMADMWRKERAQMKLAEARLQLQEKNVAIDRFRGELEEFMCIRRDVKGVLDSSDSFRPIHMNGRRNSSYEPWEMNKSGSIVDKIHSMNLKKGVHVSKEDDYGAGYHSDSHQAESLREGSLNGFTGMQKEQKVKSRCSRLKDRAKMLGRLKTMDSCDEIDKDVVNSNHDIVWEFESDMEGKKPGETLADGEAREEMLKSSTLHASTSKRMEKQNSNKFNRVFNLKIEDHKKDPSSSKTLFSDDSEGNISMSLGWEKDSKRAHAECTATKLNSVASEVKSQHGEFHLPLQKSDFQTSFVDGQCSIPTLDSGSSPHVLIPEPTRNMRKHLAKGFKGLVEWRKHNKLGSSRGTFLAED
ncbi:hypothetical protein O6H91_23G068100 [Diphasiastrum complanatum]|uniref:Uncharacterized protein n=2 Tax=Diphasiastrum complanatum TaxID=34168 RepID=A0ACC2ABW7_DIPCM|nr:hypothetical protein O6H91_23G068100 [Diphasiastrum complanatum]